MAVVLLSLSCSTEKNTSFTRFFHNTTTHYNIYFNGYMSYDAGIRKIEEADEVYTQLLPVFKGETEKMGNLVGSDMDRAVKKSVKSIKMHSITVKPDLKENGRNLTQEQKDFLEKTEYNKWIDDAYLLIGKAHYYKGEYRVSMKSLQTILTRFRKEEIRFETMYWVARCYSALNQFTDAEKYLMKITNSPDYDDRLNYEIELVRTDILVKTKKYDKASEKLEPLAKITKGKDNKARLYYLLAQLNSKTGNNSDARKFFQKVIKLNPSYDMVFSSKINLAEAYDATQGNAESLKKSLRKMLKDDKNIDYQDQIYYALAEIDMKEGNVSKAEQNYLESAKRSTMNKNQKALSFLALANIYFERPEYLKAGAYFDSTMTVLSRDYEDYDEISKTANNLSELTGNLKIVAREDSLQKVAQMSESNRTNLINNIIAQVKADEVAAKNVGNQSYDPFRQGNYNNKNTKGKWIFYNPQALSIGKSEFLKTWGKRVLEDHWRRRNKTVQNTFEEEENDTTDRITDNKDPEYYLQDLPLNDSLMAASNSKIAEALYNAAYTYESQMEAYPEAIETYGIFLSRFTKHPLVVEAYFNLYMIYFKHQKNKTKAEQYRQKILNEFPYSKYANILSDPNYLDKLKENKDKINGLYEEVFSAYKSENYHDVLKKTNEAKTLSPENDLIAGFMYFEYLAIGSLGDKEQMKSGLEEIIQKYPNHSITPLASNVLETYKSGKYDKNYYTVSAVSDTFFYAFTVHKDSTKIINKAKFLLVDFTVEKFPALDIKISEKPFDKELKIITAQGFTKKSDVQELFSSIRSGNLYRTFDNNTYNHFIISNENFLKLKKLPIIEKYMRFFNTYY